MKISFHVSSQVSVAPLLPKKHLDLCEPSFAELRKAFSNFVNHASSMKIYFFIDGVDK
jgi:hypothetical protein